MSAAWPYNWTGIIAFVFSVIASSILEGSIVNVSSSISTKTGLAPVYKIELPVAAKVNGVVITSSPSPIPAASNATCNAEVPELVAIPYFAPTKSANSFSNSITLGPWAIIPDFITSTTALISSSSIIGLAIETLISAIFSPKEHNKHNKIILNKTYRYKIICNFLFN